MIKKNYFCSAFLLAGMMASQSTSALVIGESEPNDTLGTAQSIEASFSTGTVTDIFNSDIGWEWVSVNGTGDGSFDYFSFNAVAGDTFIFDIDYGRGAGGSVDTEMGLWSSAGGPSLFQIDDCNYLSGVQDCSASALDSGTTSMLDAVFSWTFASSGTYIIGVGEFNSFDGIGGFDPGSNVLDAGDTYTLQISRDTASVPEPGVLALMSLGLISIAFSRKKKAA